MVNVNELDPFGDGSGVALYHFDGDPGEVSGSHGGTWVGTPAYVAGKFLQAAHMYDGNRVTIPLWDIATESASGFTISIWVKFPPASSIDFVYGTLFFGRSSASDSRNYLRFKADRLELTDTAETGHGVNIDNTVYCDEWLHIVASVDNAASSISFFYNGATIGTGTGPINSYPVDTLGGAYDSNHIGNFRADIDQVRIFNRPLNSQEVFELYNETFPVAINAKLGAGDVVAMKLGSTDVSNLLLGG